MLEVIAIFFVVLYHVASYKTNFLEPYAPCTSYIYYFLNTILSTCVPLFFFANGYLLFQKELKLKKLIKRIFKLITLMIIWGAITLLVLQIRYNTSLTITEYVNGVWYTKQGWNNYLWFIGSLICIYILFPIIKISFDHNKKIFIYFFCTITLFTIGLTLLNQSISLIRVIVFHKTAINEENFFGIFNPFRGIRWWSFVYFCMGGIIYLYKDKILKIPAMKRNLTAIIGIIINCFLLFSYGLFSSYSTRELYSVVFGSYDTIFTFCNTICIFLLCLNYKKHYKAITLISLNTLGIYLMHPVIDNLLPHFTTSNLLALPYSICRALFVLAISFLISILIKKIPIIRKVLL